ncbi:MAG TPA: hypothetical protein DCP02_01480 [Actinobacteria bacterium]|nr:hypothetical protein [Actinomycetota bacterium]
MTKNNHYIESIEEVRHFLKQLHYLLTDKECQLDIQRRRRNDDPDNSNSTLNTIIDLNYDSRDIKKVVLSLILSNYIKTVVDIKRPGSPDYRIFSKPIGKKNIYIKLKICNLNKIHLMSFHYAVYDINGKPYE